MAKIDKEVLRFVKMYSTSNGNRWKVCVPDGRGNKIRKNGFLERSQAVAFASREFTKTLLNQHKVMTSGDSKITFQEYSGLWIQAKIRNGLADNTKLRYENLIRDFMIPYFGAFKISELNKTHLRNYIYDSQTNGISTYNLNSSVTLLKSIIRQAIEDDYMPMSNILMVRTPKHRAKDPKFWDQSEMRFFLNAAKGFSNFNLYKFVLWTGLRGGEIAALKWSDIYLERKSGDHIGFINVSRTCAQRTLKIRETTKNGTSRVIPIFPYLRDLILEMNPKAAGDYVFGGVSPIDPSHFSRMLKQDLKKIPELKKINFHGLRHTFCSYLDSTGMNRRIVSEIMGHKDLATTNRYSHVSNQVLGHEVSRWVQDQNRQNSSKILEVAL